MTENIDQEHSRAIQLKFEFYFLALVFTVLGLSLQTAKISDNRIQPYLEIGAWVLFLISGVSGLFRTATLSIIYKYRGEIFNIEAHVSQQSQHPSVDQTPEGFKPVNKEEVSRRRQSMFDARTERRSRIIKLDKQVNVALKIFAVSFVLGLSALLASRSICILPQSPSSNKQPNQRVDPTVKTPVESGKVQGTAGHP
jgi:hypothetical protein